MTEALYKENNTYHAINENTDNSYVTTKCGLYGYSSMHEFYSQEFFIIEFPFQRPEGGCYHRCEKCFRERLNK